MKLLNNFMRLLTVIDHLFWIRQQSAIFNMIIIMLLQ